MNKILVVDDEHAILDALRFNLERSSYSVVTAMDGETALAAAREERPDLILLDLMLPGVHGLDVCRRIRAESDVPIVVLSARTEEVDRVVGLELGADDYVTKPFSMKELLARVRAHLRRTQRVPASTVADEILRDGDLTLDPARREAALGERRLPLRPKEFDLLAFLLRHPGRSFTREQLLRQVWGYEAFGQTRTVDVHIGHLRRYIEPDPEQPKRIITVRSIGYRYAG